MDTLEKAKNDLRQGWNTPQGAVCQCCGQLVKLYPRTIYAMPARALIALYVKNRIKPDYYHIRELNVDIGGSDFSKLKYWGLIEKCPINDDPGKKSSGRWMITNKGNLFVENQATVDKYAHIYNDKAYQYTGPQISIIDALGKKFDYRELMGYLI